MIPKQKNTKYKFYLSCADHKLVIMAYNHIDACSYFLRKTLGMSKDPKLSEFIYISEQGFIDDIEKYCGAKQAELVAPMRTEYVLREIGKNDLADELFVYFEKGNQDDFLVVN